MSDPRARGRLPREPVTGLDVSKVSASAAKLGAMQTQEGEREDRAPGIAPGSQPTDLGQEVSAATATGLIDATRSLSDVNFTREAFTRQVTKQEVVETEVAESAARHPPPAAGAEGRRPANFTYI